MLLVEVHRVVADLDGGHFGVVMQIVPEVGLTVLVVALGVEDVLMPNEVDVLGRHDRHERIGLTESQIIAVLGHAFLDPGSRQSGVIRVVSELLFHVGQVKRGRPDRLRLYLH